MMDLLPDYKEVSHVTGDNSSVVIDERSKPVNRPSGPAPAKKRILLADDDGGVRLMLGRVLKSENYEVIYATSGREAAAKFVAAVPHLVLLDLNMPGKDGWEAFGIMCEKHPLVPVIVITARPHQLDHAMELGVDALVEKPLNLPLLLEAIKKLLAETETECAHRLTNPRFKTTLLNPGGPGGFHGERS